MKQICNDNATFTLSYFDHLKVVSTNMKMSGITYSKPMKNKRRDCDTACHSFQSNYNWSFKVVFFFQYHRDTVINIPFSGYCILKIILSNPHITMCPPWHFQELVSVLVEEWGNISQHKQANLPQYAQVVSMTFVGFFLTFLKLESSRPFLL